jgi:hypothetical protein
MLEDDKKRRSNTMGFLDDISKAVTHGIDRAKFEAEKFQRVNRVQSELNDLKRKLDNQMIELGHRAYDLYRAKQITAHSVGELVGEIDELRSHLVVKEEELKVAQADAYAEQESSSQNNPPAQSVPIEKEPAMPQQTIRLPQKKPCPVCKFEMPMHAVFCPNCGYRVGNQPQ